MDKNHTAIKNKEWLEQEKKAAEEEQKKKEKEQNKSQYQPQGKAKHGSDIYPVQP